MGSPHRTRRPKPSPGLEQTSRRAPQRRSYRLRSAMRGGIYVLNFYSAVFVDQLKRGRKTATIRLGDKSNKYERGQVVWITVGSRHSPREKIFTAVIDDVEVKPVGRALAARHRARQPRVPPPRRNQTLPRADLQPPGRRRRPGHGDPLLADRRAAARRTSATGRRRTTTEAAAARGRGRVLVPHHLAADSPREPVWEAIHDQARLAELVARGRGRRGAQPAAGRRRRRHRLADGLAQPPALPGRVRDRRRPGSSARTCSRGRRAASSTGSGAGASTSRTGVTAVLYEWNVATTKPWMNRLAPLLRPAFEWNHDWVMARGGEGMAAPARLPPARLGLVAESPIAP